MRKKLSGCFDDSYCYINNGKKFILKKTSKSDKKVVSPNSSTIFTIDHDKKSIKKKITAEICIYFITNKNKIERHRTNTRNVKDFFLLIIKDAILFLWNDTNCLNKLNLSDLKKLPHIIYSITKDIFNIEENEIIEKIKNLYGFIYLARNQECKNKKVYVGQTIRTIEIEWGEIYGKGIRLRKKRLENPSQSNSTRYILNAIAKYPDDAWNLRLIDIAYSKSELDILERYYILDVYDSMNSEKGYNLTTGGRTGGRLSNRTKEQVSKRVKEIWNTPGYKERLSISQKETWIKGDRREKWIKAAYKSWENKERREEARKITTKNWKNDVIREKRIIGLKAASKKLWNNPSEAMLNNLKNLHQNSRKEICNLEMFLKDVKNTKYQRDFLQAGHLYDKYEIKSHMTLNKAIKKILGGFGVKNHGEAHRFFYDRSLDEVLKYLDNPQSYNIFKDPLTKQFFFDVLNSEKGSDLHIKYKVWHKNGLIIKIKRIVGKFGINNYTELKWFLQDNGIDEGLQILIELG